VFYSVMKAVIFTIVVVLIHTYYGFYAKGGPAGVGVAVGRAIRASITIVVILNMVLSIAIWLAGGETVTDRRMTPDSIVVRRIMGTAAAVLLLAVSTVIMEARFAPPAGSYEVTADLGRAGSGLRAGNDVKVRGTNVGEVSEVFYEDGRALAVLTMDPEPPLPPAEELELVVTAKTLLGEKQIELSFDDGLFGTEPTLSAGDVIVADRQPTELSEAIDALVPFVEAVDPRIWPRSWTRSAPSRVRASASPRTSSSPRRCSPSGPGPPTTASSGSAPSPTSPRRSRPPPTTSGG
jgi:hypothetical protein